MYTYKIYVCIYVYDLRSRAATCHAINTLQHIALFGCRCRFPRVCWYPLIATHCNTLHHAATHYNTHYNRLQQTATDCNRLQRIALFGCRCRLPGVCWYPLIATHCNTLHHAAMHCTLAMQLHTLPIEHIVYVHIQKCICV